ncbi:MAG: thiol:disulfide interchange protein DsbA/DsbL [Polaromonas sp.]|nr:thiol:disulfide interchange protein DsbA/DsbL [Polaromonas sp.]
MQRREFSQAALAAASAGTLAALPLGVHAQGKPPAEGKDYLLLSKPAPSEAPAGQIEVVEFFWYSCPHCNEFEPQLEAWAAKAPKDVSLRRVPVSFRPDFEPQQRLYYVLEALGKVAALHKKVFYAVHVEKQTLNTADLVTAWAQKQGIDKAKFTELYNSFPVNMKARKATQLQEAFMVDGVPALGVDGRYYTSGSLAGNMARALTVTDHLLTLARSSKAAPAKAR